MQPAPGTNLNGFCGCTLHEHGFAAAQRFSEKNVGKGAIFAVMDHGTGELWLLRLSGLYLDLDKSKRARITGSIEHLGDIQMLHQRQGLPASHRAITWRVSMPSLITLSPADASPAPPHKKLAA